MDASQPGLFDLPDDEPPTAAERSEPGRNRETWSCAVTADVTVVGEAAIREAMALAEERALVVDLAPAPDGDDVEVEGPGVHAAGDVFVALDWLIWPTDGLDEPLEAGAFRIVSIDSEVVAAFGDSGTLGWTVTVKLTDVDALRRLATEAHPDEAGPIAADLAVAWEHAVDPFAPVRTIPGISWRPGQVNVEHVPRRKSLRPRSQSGTR